MHLFVEAVAENGGSNPADAVLPVVVGALLTGVAGMVGALWRSRNEQRRWVKEKRYEAHVKVLHLLERVDMAREAVTEADERTAADPTSITSADIDYLRNHVDPLRAQLAEAIAVFDLLGPDKVAAALTALTARLGEPDYGELRTRLIRQMRKSLGIR